MNDIQIFENAEFGKVRVFEFDSEPWFVGKDVCAYFGDTNHSRTLSRVDEEDKRIIPIKDSLGRKQEIIAVNESGLYAILFAMQPQKANNNGVSDAYPIEIQERIAKIKKFKHWVTSEVLPAIRKTGSYNLPQTYAEALRALADKAEEAERLALENKEMKPKAEFFDTVADSKTALPMDQVAKVLDMGIGRNKLFEFLREHNVLQSNNVPYQRFVDAGWFRTIEQHYQKGYEPCISVKTLVYQKGVDGIRKMLLKA